MPNPTTHIDPVSAAVAVFAAFLSPVAAQVMGAYAVIFISAAFGAGWALMRREKSSLWGAIGFILLLTGTATLVTAGVAQLINSWTKLENANLLLAPVALIIGAVGHDWVRVIPILFNFLLNLITLIKAPNSGGWKPPAPPAPPPPTDGGPQ